MIGHPRDRSLYNRYIILKYVEDSVLATEEAIIDAVFGEYLSNAKTENRKVGGISKTITTLVNNGELIKDDDEEYYHLADGVVIGNKPIMDEEDSLVRDQSPMIDQRIAGIWQKRKISGSVREKWVTNTGGVLQSVVVDILDIPDPDEVHQINFLDEDEDVIDSFFVKVGMAVAIVVGRDSDALVFTRQEVHALHIFTSENNSNGYYRKLTTPSVVSVILK